MKLILRLVVLAGSIWHPAQALSLEDAPPIRPILRNIILADLMLTFCNDASKVDGYNRARQRIDEAIVNLRDALTKRAQTIGLDRDDAARGVQDYLSSNRKAPANIDQLLATCPATYDKMFSFLNNPALTLTIKQYGDTAIKRDHLFDVIAGTGQTYASPPTQQLLISSLRNHSDTCAAFRVTSIRLLGRKVQQADNLPIFIEGPVQYSEEWRTECDGVAQTSIIKHTRDSDGPVGLYSVAKSK